MHSFSGTYLNDSVLKFGLGKTTLEVSLGILKFYKTLRYINY